jgi:hypothetical protein
MKKGFLLIICLLLLIVGSWISFHHISSWLTITEVPRKSQVIICLNGNLKRIPKVVELYNQGYAGKILVTFPATRTAMITAGIPETAITSLEGGFNSTYEEAMAVVRFLELENLRSADIVSGPYHLYRVKWTYSHLADTGKMLLTYIADEEKGEQPFWWDNSSDRRTVLRELSKIAYYWIAHGLLGVRDDPPWVTEIEQWYNRILLRFV